MPSFVKNSFFGLAIICFAISCKTDTTIETGSGSVSDPLSLSTATTYTLLEYGELQPPLYANATDITGKQYNVKFIDAAGCEVSQEIKDSVADFNAKTYSGLKEIYKRDVEKEIASKILSEYRFLNRLDSAVRKDPGIADKKELKDQLIYYTKKDKNYLAHFIVAEQDHKVLIFKLKLIATVDSSGKSVLNVTEKDSLINQFSDLQL